MDIVIKTEMPDPTSGRGAKSKYPFADIPVGGGFSVECDHTQHESIRSSAWRWAKANGATLKVWRDDCTTHVKRMENEVVVAPVPPVAIDGETLADAVVATTQKPDGLPGHTQAPFGPDV